MTHDNNGAVKALWLHIASEGGRWTVKELQAISPFARLNLNQMLSDGEKIGHFVKFTESGSKTQYGVGPKCTLPRGVTVAELLKTGLFPHAEISC